jgi:hypothetical protein
MILKENIEDRCGVQLFKVRKSRSNAQDITRVLHRVNNCHGANRDFEVATNSCLVGITRVLP